MRILFAAGGTGGHINPALAVAKFFKERKSDCEILFVGTPNGMENDLVPREGFALKHIEIMGLKRKITFKNLKVLKKYLGSKSAARRIIDEFKPDFVFATGGYVTVPVIKAAHDAGIPCAVHALDAIPGLAIKMVKKKVDCVFMNFAECEKHMPGAKAYAVVGNPLRDGLVFNKKKNKPVDDGGKLNILSFAGSLGSLRFNEIMLEFIKLNSKSGEFKHVHAVGERGMKWVPERMVSMEIELSRADGIEVVEYIYNMPERMNDADLIICRSGSSLSEIAAVGKPSVLIPSPNVTGNHQYYNAKVFRDAGAAIMLEEKELSGSDIYDLAMKLKQNPERLKEMAENAEKLAIFDATQRIYDKITSMIK